ncbi:MAG: UDP-2,4-diacetamido-2,4,6-trideoxy-beta-L-altropyranose hydrolase [Alphaproteobacteria bacterium]|nr:UDP-2,4-diacetamido-2,4,6-trideoxy-beta-L-altropyranose hydrolase [Alphaproteobacteria bacterium]
MIQKAFFRFEASPAIGAGHAIRSCVIADALVEDGWISYLVTSKNSYDFIPDLKRFDRVDPEDFYDEPVSHDLLVIDHYDLDITYEQYFRTYAKKILVIDDLANRNHDCDILLDQTYGRNAKDYQDLVPENCKILTGSDYVLLRKAFIEMRPMALEKRRKTKEIKRILISMGGSDPQNHTLQALEMIKETGFKGEIDIVLGFKEKSKTAILDFLKGMPNLYRVHVNPNMVQLMYEADLAIGAAGSSVWERCCLWLPQVVMITAENQKNIYALPFYKTLKSYFQSHQTLNSTIDIDGFGINRLLLEILSQCDQDELFLSKITESDKNKIYQWQQLKEIRKYFNNPTPPSRAEHDAWFLNRLQYSENPYWLIRYNSEDCGVLSLTYNKCKQGYDLSWFITPQHRGKGFGTVSLVLASKIVFPHKIFAHVKEDNMASQNALKKAGFQFIECNNYVL